MDCLVIYADFIKAVGNFELMIISLVLIDLLSIYDDWYKYGLRKCYEMLFKSLYKREYSI